MRNAKSIGAFTLIELSIVIVIIGLLVGGVMMGQELLRQSKVMKIMPMADEVIKATRLFKDKYQYYPGDMRDAEAQWGSVVGDPWFVRGTNGQTFNGNGDDKIENSSLTPGQEQYRFWQHLAQSGLYNNSLLWTSAYNEPGVGAARCIVTTDCTIPGINVPTVGVEGVGMEVAYTVAVPVTVLAPEYVSTITGHYLQVGTSRSGWSLMDPALSIGEALSLETKFDDGMPRSGKVFGLSPALQGCYENNGGVWWTTPGNVPKWGGSNPGIRCAFTIYMGF